MLYHAGVPFAPGGYVGVDVFFVISGYLITGLLLRELEKTGTLTRTLLLRRAKRLLPLTVVVLGAVVLVVGMWPRFDPVRMDEVSFGVVSSVSTSNWLLAARPPTTSQPDCRRVRFNTSGRWQSRSSSTSCGRPSSWPPRGGVAARAGVCGRHLRQLAAVTIASLTYSVYSTQVQAGAAYFSTPPTRGCSR